MWRYVTMGTLPPIQGLYDPRNEHDACGVGFVANIKGQKSHEIIRHGLQILANLTHRGATGADPLAGDGAGLLLQVPDAFLRAACDSLGISLPPATEYGVGCVFLPPESCAECEALIGGLVAEEGQQMLGWRDVPTDNSCVGEGVKAVEPVIRQFFVGRGDACVDADA
ncbi:MAG: glutamate synthase subunit alpha, partial [Gammaproteobacteria bacterium]